MEPITCPDPNVLRNDAVTLKQNTHELCRLCANTDNQLIPIFRGDGLEHNISGKIEKYLPIITVTESDVLPSRICYQCASTLLAWHSLYEGCVLADERLRGMLPPDDKIEDEVLKNHDSDNNGCDSPERADLERENLDSNMSGDESAFMNTGTHTNESARNTDETGTENTNLDRCIARGRRKRGHLTTTCDVKKEPVKRSRNRNAAKENCNFAHLVQPNQLLSQTTVTRIPSQRPILPRASSTPVLLSPITTIAVNPITTVPLLIKLHPVSTVTGMPTSAQSQKCPKENQTSGYKCSKCPAVLRRRNDLNRHMRFSHYPDSNLQENTTAHSCHYCGYRCKRKYDIKRHILSMHLKLQNEEKLICSVCERSFENKSTLRKHVMKSHFDTIAKSNPVCFCCDICYEGFYASKTLLAHYDVVHPDNDAMSWHTFRTLQQNTKLCNQCNRNYRESKFDEHLCVAQDNEVIEKMKNAMNTHPTYKCDLCSLCFSWKLLYRQHREDAHPDAVAVDWENLIHQSIQNYCSFCLLALDENEILANHHCIKPKEEDRIISKTHTCSLCNSSYTRKSDFYRHMRNKHPSDLDDEGITQRKTASISCPYCEETAANRILVLNHIKSVHNIDTDTPFICVPCNKTFKRKTTLDTHNETYHPTEQSKDEADRVLKESEILLNGEKAFHCSICNRNMFDPIRFVAHHRLHNVERKYTCDLCGKQTRTQHQLNSHIKFIHLDIRNYECDICGKSFHAKQSCEEHRRIHTGERPFSCEICGKTFIAMNALFTHQKFHNDFYAHSCHLCPKKFKIRRSLINHIRTHTGERPFQCDLCSKTFNNSSRFSYHKKVTHSDNRPFTCSQCGSCFKANKFLMRHVKLHDVRTHIQFRRRNNPSYFASQKTAGGEKNCDNRKLAEPSQDDHGNYAIDESNDATEDYIQSVNVKGENAFLKSENLIL